MPNLNAALLVAQLEQLNFFIKNKRKVSDNYRDFFKNNDIIVATEISGAKSNYWLNALILKDSKQRDLFLEFTNSRNIMTRPIWTLMNKISMFKKAQCGDLTNAEWLEERVVSIPSGVVL
jgi:perosamine synthetase